MVMNNNKQVFGVVENVELNKDYKGESTDTAIVTVNNTDRTIKVDVDFSGMLGHTSGTAYPGHEGYQDRQNLARAFQYIENETTRALVAEKQLEELIHDEVFEVAAEHTVLKRRVDYIDETYATQEYVMSQLIEFNKLHKQIVDEIDFENNTVVTNGIVEQAQDNTIYLVKEFLDSEEVYNQYILIDGKLTFIGSSKIDLSDYATKDFVTEQIEAIPEVDLTDYAKLTDIPDVSDFLNEIPPEYITETELDEKDYLTKVTAESDYATKVYVQAELSKIGTLSKELVDSINLETNKIIIEGEEKEPNADTIYLVPIENTNTYDQYTVINGVLTYIGNTSVDLDGYATKDYVDETAAKLLTDVENMFKSIKFIDGGNAPL